MTKKYFLGFDYWTTKEERFFSSIIDADLSEISLIQICRDRIRAQAHNEHVDAWTVKVTSFNRI